MRQIYCDNVQKWPQHWQRHLDRVMGALGVETTTPTTWAVAGNTSPPLLFVFWPTNRVFIYTLSSWQQWRKIWLRIGPGKSLLSWQWWSFSYLSAGRAEQWGSLLSVAVPQCPPAWWSCSCSGGPVEWIKHTPKGEEEKETLVLLWVNSSVHCVCVMFSFSYQ